MNDREPSRAAGGAAHPYVVRPEPELDLRREASFESLTSARYFARTWAFKSHVPILVIDGRSGEAVERYSARTPRAPDLAKCGPLVAGERLAERVKR